MRSAIFYTTGIAFTSGIFFRSFFDFGYAGALLPVLIGGALFIVWHVQPFRHVTPILIVAIACVACACGILRMEHAESSVSPLHLHVGRQVLLYGTVRREPEFRERMVHLYADPNIDGSDELVLVTTDKFSFSDDTIGYGDTVRVDGILKKPEPFTTDEGRTFDYRGYLKSRDVNYMIQYGKVDVEEQGTGFLASLYNKKHEFMYGIERAIPEPEAGLGEGVLLGVKRALGDSLEEVFRTTGIIHIVVLSGYNIMIVVECITYILALFFFPRTRMVLGIGIVILFALLVGLSATVMRASLMAILLIVARNTGRTYAVLRALMIALVLMLMWNPYLLVHDTGFQLSFLATLGLILFSPHIEHQLTIVPRFLGVRTFVTATIAAQLAVLPLLLYHTGLVSVVSLVANVLVLPVVPVAMGLTFLTGVFGSIVEIVGTVVGFFAHAALGYIIVIAKLCASLPFASFSISAFPFWIVLVSYALMGACYAYIARDTHDIEIDDEENSYADWVIEEEKPARESQNNSRAGSTLR